MSIKSRLQGFALKLAARSIRDESYEASDAIGTLHFAHWVPFEQNHLGFFTIFDGDFEKYIQDFAEKTSSLFDAVFPHVDGAPPTPVEKNAEAFYQWALENNHPPIGFYSAYPGLGVQDIRALLAESRVAIGLLWMTACRPGRARGYFAGCLTRDTEGDSPARRISGSTSRTSRGSSSAATACRWCGSSC